MRLINNGVTEPINLFVEGKDNTNLDSINCTNFPVNYIEEILLFLQNERVRAIPAGDQFECGTNSQSFSRVYNYYVGSGVIGDLIAAYLLPRVGPWFTIDGGGAARLEKFLKNNLEQFGLTPHELDILGKFATEFNLESTNRFTVKTPSIIDKEFVLIYNDNRDYIRNLFLETLNKLLNYDNVSLFTQSTGLRLEQNSDSSFNATFRSAGVDQLLESIKPVWMTNLYTYLRLSTLAGIRQKVFNVPSIYRARIPIPDTGIPCKSLGDLVTTYQAFSLKSASSTSSQALTWLVQAYTAVEDLSVVASEGRYADAGHTLLIIEAINAKNRRATSYNPSTRTIDVQYNAKKAERGWLEKFAEIVAVIYLAYTGLTITKEKLLNEESFCASSSCTDSLLVTDHVTRESPMVTMLELGALLYGHDLLSIAAARCASRSKC
jgi:hypothetical protein